MKLAILKLGGRLNVDSSSTSGGNGEALSIIKILLKDGHSVDAFTEIKPRDKSPEDFNMIDILENYDNVNKMGYDALIVINGNVNFFGGAEDRGQILNYHIINNFNGRVYYFMCDAALTLSQIWKGVEKKEWGSNYKEKDILITRNDIIYISQARDEEQVLERARKKVDIKEVRHFPFEKFPYFNIEDSTFDVNKCEYDISYGGTFRGGKREVDMVKFYFGYPDDIKVEMFGKIEQKHFKKDEGLKPPIFNKPIAYNEFDKRMEKGLSTIIIGDKLYKQLDNLAQRIYESILIGNIVFIDESYDFNHRVFKNDILLKFNYVNSRDDVIERIRILKKNPQLIEKIIKLQKQDAYLDMKEYVEKLTSLIKD